jgi:hypothetical protein
MVATAAYRYIIAISRSFAVLFGGASPLPQPCVPTVTSHLVVHKGPTPCKRYCKMVRHSPDRRQ